MRDDPVAEVLDNLMKFDEILACMVARRGMIDSVMPSSGTDSFKDEIYEVWDVLKRTMDSQLSVISEFSRIDLKKIDFELQEFDAMFYVIPETENALVAIVPALANKGLIDVELERARLKIYDLLKEENNQ